ncbi:MAG TPA: hypothetical protein VG167_16410 [Verrucomicrobiae bacterium]|nr:hypothetical protein [Verrucomicrobiae bacterium]
MKTKFIKYALLTALGLGASGMLTAQANTMLFFSVDMATNLDNGTFNPAPPDGTGTDVVAVRGTFNAWSVLPLFRDGTSSVFTNSFNDTADLNGHVVSYRFRINGTDESTASWDNRAAQLPTTSGASLALPTPYYGDVGPGQIINVTFQVDMSEEIQLGHFTPGVDQVDIRGSFNGWANTGAYLVHDPSVLVTNLGGIVTSNVYTLEVPITSGAQVPGVPATNAFMEWKAVEDVGGNSNWENPGPTSANDAQNRFWVNNTNQVLPVVSFSDLPYAPLAQVGLNLDMTGVVAYDTNYVPNSVTVWGTFNNWANGVMLTNNPAGPNTNLFSTTIIVPEGVSVIYQFRYTNSLLSGWVYDYASDGVYNNNLRRTLEMPITPRSMTTNLPTVFFLDLAPGDYLPQDTPVLFTVDMSHAIGTEGWVFDPNTDGLYINGSFANGGFYYYPQTWYGWTNNAPAGYQMGRVGTSLLYTNLLVLPRGTPVAFQYQYGMDPYSVYAGPLQDEATGINHFRVVRSTGLTPYVMPIDAFTNAPHQEPLFAPANIDQAMGTLAGGNLTIGAPSGGNIPISWLGRPGAQLQVKTSLSDPVWQALPSTDGLRWTNGVNTPNGLLSVTNWPSTGSTYFRLVRP